MILVCFDFKVVSHRGIDKSHFTESRILYKWQFTIWYHSPKAIAQWHS